MNIFSSDIYLATVGDIYFPGREWAFEICRVGGKYFRLLVIDRKQVITSWAFLDFLEPLDAAPALAAKEVPYIPSAVLETVPADRHAPGAGRVGVDPAPFIVWNQFADWDSFEALVATRRKNLKREAQRKHRGLQNTLGSVDVVLSDHRAEVFEQCIRWKSAQYLRTGLRDMFAKRENVRLFQELQRKQVLVVSSISAGGKLLAVHFGALLERTFYSWIAAYDPAHSTYSPGALLLEALLAESWKRKDLEFNFLIGDQEYKWFYATHNRVIGAIGKLPVAIRLARAAKRPIRRALAKNPRLLLLARRMMRRLES